MSRPLKQTYRCEPLRELARQLQFAPHDKRVTQIQHAEQLHDAIDPARTYPFEFIVYRLTGYRPQSSDTNDTGDTATAGSLLLVGEAIRPDLRLLIDQLSRAVTLPHDEPTETVEQLACRMNVATKTIARWRRDGLRWRWMAPSPGSRKRIVIPQSAVEHFQRRHPDRVAQASRFSQLDPATRDAIIRRARRLAEARDVSFNQIADHLARRTGRALETIRLILDKHDRANPDDPIFIDRTGPLTARQRRVIARARRRGISVTRLSRRFNRTRATIHRVVHQQRAAEARRLPLTYVPSPIFNRDDADAVILRADTNETTSPPSSTSSAARPPRVPVSDLPEPLRRAFTHPPIPADRLRSLFIRYNYLKYKASRLRDSLHRHEPRSRDLDAFDRLIADASRVQATLIAAHRPTLLSIARRHLISDASHNTARLLEVLEAGHPVLVEAVEQFNASRSAAFESYLTNRLLRRFAADRTDTTTPRARKRRSLDDITTTLLHQLAPTI